MSWRVWPIGVTSGSIRRRTDTRLVRRPGWDWTIRNDSQITTFRLLRENPLKEESQYLVCSDWPHPNRRNLACSQFERQYHCHNGHSKRGALSSAEEDLNLQLDRKQFDDCATTAFAKNRQVWTGFVMRESFSLAFRMVWVRSVCCGLFPERQFGGQLFKTIRRVQNLNRPVNLARSKR